METGYFVSLSRKRKSSSEFYYHRRLKAFEMGEGGRGWGERVGGEGGGGGEGHTAITMQQLEGCEGLALQCRIRCSEITSEEITSEIIFKVKLATVLTRTSSQD